MQKFYKVSKVALVVGFERYDVHPDGGVEVKTNQTITYDKLYTPDQLLELMKAKIEPDETITCEIDPNVLVK